MAIRQRTAIQSSAFFAEFDGTSTPVPGLTITAKANSQFYLDIRGRIDTPNGNCGIEIRVDNWTVVRSANQVLTWSFANANNSRIYFKGFPQNDPAAYIWSIDPSTVIPAITTMDGILNIFGVIQNTNAFDVQIVVSINKLITSQPTSFASIQDARMLLYEDSSQFPSQSINSDMTHCGCCATAEISCCQTSLTINTINPSSGFDWKITDSLGAVYTGTMETDSGGIGVITVGDGMDLPDGFLDAPGVGFKIEFLDGRPTIASKMSCLDVELVSGAYLAIQDIGEPLP